MKNVYGYVRVSSCDQNEDRQMIAMQKARIPRKNIYMDKQSGKDFDRPMYKKMVRKLRDEVKEKSKIAAGQKSGYCGH